MPYLKQTKNIEELIPWLYLREISTSDIQSALESLLGKHANGLFANSVYRLKQQGEAKYDQWRKRDLNKRQYLYIWVDGVYCKVRMDDKFYLLVVIGVDDAARKDMLAVIDGYRELEISWPEVLSQLTSPSISIAHELAIGDGAFSFWNAVTHH
ncbi:transposase [Candidatus Enterovibrio escicola]|uniref:transposase n=1 Tax=Candidatus Enterovibrio escicola TaxID=1927127 RepID=UPI001CC25C7A|nr:transposase [Candidatus Enterovibrio escacola]